MAIVGGLTFLTRDEACRFLILFRDLSQKFNESAVRKLHVSSRLQTWVAKVKNDVFKQGLMKVFSDFSGSGLESYLKVDT